MSSKTLRVPMALYADLQARAAASGASIQEVAAEAIERGLRMNPLGHGPQYVVPPGFMDISSRTFDYLVGKNRMLVVFAHNATGTRYLMAGNVMRDTPMLLGIQLNGQYSVTLKTQIDGWQVIDPSGGDFAKQVHELYRAALSTDPGLFLHTIVQTWLSGRFA